MGEVQLLHDRLDDAARRERDRHAQCPFVALRLLQGIELAPEQRRRHEMIATAAQAVTALQKYGDMMLSAIIFHSDHLELSEQFDATSGYEKSVSDLTWSYAAFLSAVRAKAGSAVLG